jgi:hypothetical protein
MCPEHGPVPSVFDVSRLVEISEFQNDACEELLLRVLCFERSLLA